MSPRVNPITALCKGKSCDHIADGAQGLCSAHYTRLRKWGDIREDLPVRPRDGRPRPCSVEECPQPLIARGLCMKHYTRLRRSGRVEGIDRPHRPSDASPESERFWERVRVGEDAECWLWLGGQSPGGYGVHFFYGTGGRRIKAHRFAYELLFGPITEGLTIDHLCFNRLCVNPAHLEAVTREENVRRAWRRKEAAEDISPR